MYKFYYNLGHTIVVVCYNSGRQRRVVLGPSLLLLWFAHKPFAALHALPSSLQLLIFLLLSLLSTYSFISILHSCTLFFFCSSCLDGRFQSSNQLWPGGCKAYVLPGCKVAVGHVLEPLCVDLSPAIQNTGLYVIRISVHVSNAECTEAGVACKCHNASLRKWNASFFFIRKRLIKRKGNRCSCFPWHIQLWHLFNHFYFVNGLGYPERDCDFELVLRLKTRGLLVGWHNVLFISTIHSHIQSPIVGVRQWNNH